jgi:hypothetical protein
MKNLIRYRKAIPLLSMILALLIVVSCGSSHTPLVPYDESASEWDAIVDEHISDKQRAERLKQYGLKLDRLQASVATEVAAVNKKLIALNVDYASTRDEMQQAIAAFTEKRNAALIEYRDIIFSMRQEVSHDEWQALMK